MKQLNMRRQFAYNRTTMTYVFLAIQILAYIVMTLDGGSTNILTLVNYGAKVNELIVAGEYWRLVTPIFLHIGFTHILLNSITLYYLGTQMELIYGSLRFTVIYFLGGIMGNLMSFAFSNAISAGASTSLFGLFAAAIVLGRMYPNNYAIRQMAQNFTILIILNFVTGFMASSVDNWGHLGGALGGGLAAVFVSVPRYSAMANRQRILSVVLYAGLAIFFIFIGFTRFGFGVY